MNPMRRYLDIVNEAGQIKATPLNDAFWRWFGNSKIVDHAGRPLIVWHGVKNPDMRIDAENKQVIFIPPFDVFDTEKRIEPGAWFSPHQSVAAHYGTPVPFYLKSERPCREESPIERIPDGCDGVYRMRGKGDAIADAWEIAVFRPEQIKAAFNDGTFGATAQFKV